MKRGAAAFCPGDFVMWKVRFMPLAGPSACLFTENPCRGGRDHDPRLQRYAICVWTVIAADTPNDYVLVLTPEGTGWTGAEFIEKL